MKYLITTEKHEVYLVRRQSQARTYYCADCQKQVEIMSLETATTLTSISTREIFRLVEYGEIHSIETEKGHLFICKEFLENFKK